MMPMMTMMLNDDNTRLTIHDDIGSLAFMPNEPKGKLLRRIKKIRQACLIKFQKIQMIVVKSAFFC